MFATETAIEKIPVRRIRLMHAAQRATAVAACFFTVDRVLLEWSQLGDGVLDCDFEIVYEDGITLCGHFHFRRKGSRRPALMPFICKDIAARCGGARHADGAALRGLTPGPHAFLQHYETNDFALA